ncbi:hypothetical protein [Thalassospira mesophila]|uniref:Membrane protein n=1 Tax=Thalassospira mesophila TaxID=1293891 RepID=A0A1Y2KVU8_9PROT|nr:hypothetical protein [Thalassospira mesophila]OSQ35990.1 membrane protein [Thalassospira mesophila]
MALLKDTPGEQIFNKVPEVTLYFWIIKIMATTVGETAADYLNVDMGFGLTVTSWIMAGLLIAALLVQVSKKKYEPWIYWLTVILISIVGTLITDNLVDNMGISLEVTTVAFSIALAITFIAWFCAERTLSIHSIYTTRREIFYWLTILFTFALGTAGGDLASEGLNWGYAQSALIFGGLIALTTLAFYFLRLNAVLAFWIAYILTRPLGASLGDLMSQPPSEGGLGLGTFEINAVFFAVIIALVAFLTVTRKDQLPVTD